MTKKSDGNGHQVWSSRILTGQAFIEQYTPPDWLIDGIVQRGRLYACTSLTGHGKTAVWAYNACMIAAGRKIAGLETTRSTTLILAGENPDDLQARLLGMKAALNLRPTDLPYVLPVAFPLTDEAMEVLLHEIQSMFAPLGLVIADTAPSYFPGEDEIDNVAQGAYARRLRRVTQEAPGKPAMMALCHPTKAAGQDSLVPRGGGAFLNELDGNLTLWSKTLGEETTLSWQGKLRGAPFSPLNYQLRQMPTGFNDNRDRPVTTIIAEPISEFEAANRSEQNIADAEAVLKRLHYEPKASMADIANFVGWTKDGKPQKWKVQDALEKLEKAKLVSSDFRGKYQVTDSGRKFLLSNGL